MGQWSGPHKGRTHDVTGARNMREHRARKRAMAEERNEASPGYRRAAWRRGDAIDTILNAWQDMVRGTTDRVLDISHQMTAADVSKRGMRKRRRPGTATPVAEAHNAPTVTTIGDYL